MSFYWLARKVGKFLGDQRADGAEIHPLRKDLAEPRAGKSGQGGDEPLQRRSPPPLGRSRLESSPS
uniref:Uncharacterized protein n=1 Tax=Candidatus Kentrum sp. SD TaxID=2126332 RepID=A0A451BIQ3_9GAMM|nr:MAG: hypothetical protein BECKSD772F_GA0070984_101827 [Candidatus Kentron sp. SD]VFK42502.1 MAG: hypothetical protein BECKSD772E_GA0070983_101727 [Candidatus Kentron sp. SD]VFK78157.1 MAG: hypothetical protein BECKSD772D_GA0070982_100824 [Candidatus Kentron sp. SD]